MRLRQRRLKSPRLYSRFILGLWILIAQPAGAWSAKGHAVIAQSALAQLPGTQQRFFNSDASALLKNDKAKKWRYSLKGFTPFAMAAVWPDTRRDATLSTLFHRYAKSPVMQPLTRYASYKTANWHYVNQQFWHLPSQQLIKAQVVSHSCRPKANGYLVKIWPDLITAYSQANSAAERGFLVAFISHLLADAYQPLHTLAALNNRCKHDAGGNGHCLVHHKNGRCQLNLHRLWDGGFGVFEQLRMLNITKSAITQQSLLSAQQLVPNAAVAHGALAPFIYSAAQGQAPSSHYRHQAADITHANAQNAVHQLAALLSYLYSIANK